MNASESKKLETIKKKLNCDLVDCRECLQFEVLDAELKHLEKEKVRYRGKCTKCNSSVVLNNKQIELLEKAIGKIHIAERKLNFDSLFDTDE
ncbi:hypothetical protein Q8A57_00020 [Porticoccus litoralis]|uniref:Uncharacterized protein n=1 Tax=Porticoccus litoralis TaxID=434086 RepID=A0AAW8B144_9GAMM|nr:hypothetical protein [Porticoccus litoralis]MDP1519350.1 hypothetical protein [Porticoccus litoralis]